MNRNVVYVRFHADLDIPGLVGSIGKVLPSQGKTFNELKMVKEEDQTLSISFKYLGKPISVSVPFTNIILMRVETETK